ncbi:uncharacterized protein LOC128393382 [Panonychus citri]|uniref:uncharacterized protein LOC128393382 n=1 Tax=Panonychus citri TaxID=50023 RepID=UPI002306F3F8|nr:uncharacterized protein LOC128393382 [Panonychus citri]
MMNTNNYQSAINSGYTNYKRKLINLIRNLLCLPNQFDSVDFKIIELFKKLEKTSIMFVGTRRGYSQSIDEPIPRKMLILNYLFCFLSISLMIRCFLLSLNLDEYPVIISDIKVSGNNHGFLALISATFALLEIVCHVCILYIEEKGVFVILFSKYFDISIENFNSKQFHMNSKQFHRFKRMLYIILTLCMRNIIVEISITGSLVLLIRFGSLFSSSSIGLIISSFFWLIVELIVFTGLGCGLTVTIYQMLISVTIYHFQLKSLNDKVDDLSTNCNNFDRKLIKINGEIIRFYNEAERWFSSVKMFILFIFIQTSLFCDMMIFLGSMVQIVSKDFSILMSSTGYPIIIFTGFVCYNLATLHSMVRKFIHRIVILIKVHFFILFLI